MADRGNKFLRVYGQRWDPGNGEIQNRFKYSVGSGQGVLVVAFTPPADPDMDPEPKPGMQIIVVDEFQPNTNRIRSCVGFGVEAGKDLETTAQIGLLKKTGYTADDLDVVATIVKDISYTDDTMTIFLARNCKRMGPEVPGVTLMDPRQYAREFMEALTEDPLRPNDGIFTLLGLVHISKRLGLDLFR